MAFLSQPHDTFTKSSHEDLFAYDEYERTQGIALTGRSLQHLADNLGRHYIKSLTRSGSAEM